MPGDRLERVERLLDGLLREHLRLLAEGRVADRHLHGEAVELRLGQRVGALVLDGILGRDGEERPLQLVALAVDRHLRLLHRLEQGRLSLRRGAVDLVDEQDVREHGPRPEAEPTLLLVVDVDTGDVRREQVGRELEP